ncbi:MAG: acyltransferase [Planctomycetia bacterium]|nr:acyltransferase [Planctomycetia bacterium]
MRYPLLDPLRGVAAVWVFLHHVVYAFYTTPAPDLLRLGYFGVPMFFVISGYCLTAASRRAVQTGEAPERFLLRRALRIYPPFWAAVVLAVAVFALLPILGSALNPFEVYLREEWKSVELGEWVKLFTLTTAFRPSGELPWDKFRPVNLAFWTLAIEIQFYAVVWLAVRAGRWFYAILSAITLASIPFVPSASAFSSGWFLPFWPFFALGIGLYAALEHGRSARSLFGSGWCGRIVRLVLLVAGTALAAWGLSLAPLMPDGTRAMMAGEFAFAGGYTLVLWVLWSPPGEKRVSGPLTGVLSYLGAASYSIYLLHIPLMLLVSHAVACVLPTHSVAFLVVTVVVVCALVYPFYRWVEKPCMTSGKRPRVGQASCLSLEVGQASSLSHSK